MKRKLIRKKLCVLGLVAASVSAGVATPLALSTTQAQEVQAETNSSTKAKRPKNSHTQLLARIPIPLMP